MASPLPLGPPPTSSSTPTAPSAKPPLAHTETAHSLCPPAPYRRTHTSRWSSSTKPEPAPYCWPPTRSTPSSTSTPTSSTPSTPTCRPTHRSPGHYPTASASSLSTPPAPEPAYAPPDNPELFARDSKARGAVQPILVTTTCSCRCVNHLCVTESEWMWPATDGKVHEHRPYHYAYSSPLGNDVPIRP